jgi:hypothetical protein
MGRSTCSQFDTALGKHMNQKRYGFARTAYITGIELREDWKNYIEDLDKLRSRKRVWILLSHFYRGRGIDERLFLDQIGNRVAFIKAYGSEM